MSQQHDVRVRSCRLYFLPVVNRMPLKFGRETITGVTCARVAVRVEGRRGEIAEGWGETPLNVSWLWPSARSHAARDRAVRSFCRAVAERFPRFPEWGHAMELGHLFLEHELPGLLRAFGAGRPGEECPPWLAALAAYSAFDLAVHDAYGRLHGTPTYATYTSEYMNHDLAWFYDADEKKRFAGAFPADFLAPMSRSLPAWHLVGGLDPLTDADRRGDEPEDGYPAVLEDWIRRDGLACLKVKLSGDDAGMDYARLRGVGEVAAANGAAWLCADFNCTVKDPEYVVDIMERIRAERPDLDAMLLYLEQPFPPDLRGAMLDVRRISGKRPLFMDESADDWRQVRLGRSLGWTGVALKTCKTQTGALLSLCWAKANGMPVMVQDLTNPMLAQMSHLLLAAHAGTLMGVETNAMQFYPEASAPERRVHPGLYERRDGRVNLDSLAGSGFGYRLDEIARVLPEPEGNL